MSGKFRESVDAGRMPAGGVTWAKNEATQTDLKRVGTTMPITKI